MMFNKQLLDYFMHISHSILQMARSFSKILSEMIMTLIILYLLE